MVAMSVSSLEDVYFEKIDALISEEDFYPYTVQVDPVIHELSLIEDRSLTLHEVYDAFDDHVIDESDYRGSEDYPSMRLVDLFYKHWVDLDAVKSRADNLLTYVPTADDSWKVNFHIAVAKYMKKSAMWKGTEHKLDIININPLYYSRYDYESCNLYRHIVGVFNVHEEYWSEFEGTFFTGDDSHTGLVADAVFDSGASRKVSIEGDIAHFMKVLT